MPRYFADLAALLTEPRRTLAHAWRDGTSLSLFFGWLALETLLVFPMSVAEQVLRLAQSPAAALGGLWATYLAHALGPAIVLTALTVMVTLARRASGRSAREPWTVAGVLSLTYAPHVLLTAIGATLAALGLSIPLLPHDVSRLDPTLALIRGVVSLAPSAVLFILALRAAEEPARSTSAASALDAPPDSNTPPSSAPAPRGALLAAVTVVLAVAVAASIVRVAKDYEVARPVAGGAEVPPFELAGLSGGTLRSTDLLGKVAIIDFWATWCVPCIATMPLLERLHRELGPQGFVLVSVNVEPAAARTVPPFVEKHKVTAPIYRDDGTLQRALKVQGLPTAVLLDAHGHVNQVYVGITPYERLKSDVLALLERR